MTSPLYQEELSLEVGVCLVELVAVVTLAPSHTTALTTVHQKTGAQEQEHTPIMQAQSLILKLRKSMSIT